MYAQKTVFEKDVALRCITSVEGKEFPKPGSGCVRAKMNIAGWYAKQKAEGQLAIAYLNHADPGG
jgi:hypothetical protein